MNAYYYFPLTISIHFQEVMLWDLTKWSPKRECLDLLSNSLNTFFNKIYRDQFGEFLCVYLGLNILRDPGTVSQVGRKGGTKVFKYRRKSPWVPTLTELPVFPKIQADASSWLGTKNALYYCAQSANSLPWKKFSQRIL